MNFRSDNEAPAAPEILGALQWANAGHAPAYGADEWTARLEARLGELFERPLRAFPMASGTAANALGLAQLAPPWGAVLCHEEAHIQVDECGAPEFYSGGAKLMALSGEHGRLMPEAVEACLAPLGQKGDHDPLPSALSLTQATECGTVYPIDQVAALCELAHARGMRCHMDGARFANAVVSLGCTPAETTWRAGVDLLSLGATKNGALLAEVLVFFDPALADGFGRRRMKGGHLLSKMRYVSAQLLAWFEDDLWLRLATRANAGAQRLGEALAAHPDAELVHPVEANEVFVRLEKALHARLSEVGFAYHGWPGEPGLYRLVVPWNVTDQDLDLFVDVLEQVVSGR